MVFSIQWPRVIRRALRVLAAIVCVIIIAWLCLVWYVNAHKEEILAKLSTTVSGQMRGELKIGSMEPSLFHSFPDISLVLKDVSLRDSLWTTHRHSLLEAKDVFVRVNPFALIGRRVELRKITVARGSIFLYTDATGYSNSYLLAQRDTSKKNHPALVDYFGLNDMHFWFVNEMKRKLFHLHIGNLDGISSRSAGLIRTRLKGSVHVYDLSFSTIRGSYVRNQDLGLNLSVDYHIGDKHLHIAEQALHIGSHKINLGGDFYFNRTPAAFAIHLVGQNLPYKTALGWASPNIQRVLKPYDFSKPISIDVRVSGVMQYRSIPLIKANYTIQDNTLVTQLGNIDHLTYNGEYYNEAAPGAGHGDENSRVAMYGMSGSWQGIPFSSDTLAVTNLLKPVVKAHIKSSFPVTSLNNVIGGAVMSFERGKAEADLRYNGGILPDDPTPYAINGYVRVADAGLSYLPRNLTFTNVGASLIFQDDNLFFRNITLRSKQSSVSMEGDALHFLRLYFSDPGKVTVNWRLRGALINLNDYLGLFAKRRRTATAGAKRANGATRIGTQLDRVLDAASFSVNASVDHILYKSFNANTVIAQATFSQSGITLQQVQIRNGGGSLNISGSINQAAANNPFHIKAIVRDADVAKLFSSFDNFGQSAISANNLAGRITADAELNGNVTDAGTILKNSFRGGVSFKLEDGQINHFSPFEKVGKFVFKKRNLSAVDVKELQGKLDIDGSKIIIRPMSIQTSVVNMNVQGVYGLTGGTDIFIEVPLRNPEKEGAATPIGMLLRTGKGFVVHLRAQDPTGDGVKIGWDPLRHGRKNTGALPSGE